MTKVQIINELIRLGYTTKKYAGPLWKMKKKELEETLEKARKKK